jgi:hypothetical protein
VDDILITCDQRKTLEEILTELNEQCPTIKFTVEKGLCNSIKFLDLSVHHRGKELEFAIYRKLTQIDIIIPNNSCHLLRHKISNISYLVNKYNTQCLKKPKKMN